MTMLQNATTFRYLIFSIAAFIFLFASSTQAQSSLEFKVPMKKVFNRLFEPSIEYIEKNDRIGFEIGAGSYQYDIPWSSYIEPNTFIAQHFTSSAAIKYYISTYTNQGKLSFYIGPYLGLDKIIYLDDEPNLLQEQSVPTSPYNENLFRGKRYIDAGIVFGLRLIRKKGFLASIGANPVMLYTETIPGFFERDGFRFYPDIRLGYSLDRTRKAKQDIE